MPADGSAVTPKRPYLHRTPHLMSCAGMVTPLKRPEFPRNEENCRNQIRLSPPHNKETQSTSSSTDDTSCLQETPQEVSK
ncbi:Hypp9424 [Branchiostoma lanceolatum]|uniref:Hypp9424 protein n=1 Tax=Branchiostoma lanceolatum TaxID=7740 RepID=A0A8S4MMS5_BRALA|nr:Hypp9424 [Branchiostoma lanceolatum]